MGVLIRGTGPLQNIGQADIWVSAEHTLYVEQMRLLSDRDLHKVRSVPGVEWAVPFFYWLGQAQLPSGQFRIIHIVGIDRMTMVGQPPEMLEGRLEDLRAPDAVIVDDLGKRALKVEVGDQIRLFSKQARVVGVCRAKRGLLSKPLLYTTFENGIQLVPLPDNHISYILADVKAGHSIQDVKASIDSLPDVQALTAGEMRTQSMDFVMNKTGLGINFFVTVTLGFIVGLVVSMAVFNQFTSDNLPHYAVLKAMGARSTTLIGMILAQAAVVTLISYGIGVGLASLTNDLLPIPEGEIAAHYPWQLMVAVMVPLVMCVSLASLVSLIRVLRLEPATVFA